MILTADIHLRRTTPSVRMDNYFVAQEKKFRFILEQAQLSPPLLVAGDFFHIAKPGEGLLRWVIDLLREYRVSIICTPGQHDLPNHSIEQIGESGLGVLKSAGVITILEEFSQPIILATGSEIIWGCAYGQ
jgi:DNA repair exonuclease SbcCD nuclease subunit